MTEPYTLAGAVKILKRHYPDLKPEAVQEYLEYRDTGLAEKYSRIDFEAYKSVALTKKERRILHVKKLAELMLEENLTPEELVTMGLSPMPAKKPAAKKPEQAHSRSTSPESMTEPGKHTLIIPVMRLPVSGSVTLKGGGQ